MFAHPQAPGKRSADTSAGCSPANTRFPCVPTQPGCIPRAKDAPLQKGKVPPMTCYGSTLLLEKVFFKTQNMESHLCSTETGHRTFCCQLGPHPLQMLLPTRHNHRVTLHSGQTCSPQCPTEAGTNSDLKGFQVLRL